MIPSHGGAQKQQMRITIELEGSNLKEISTQLTLTGVCKTQQSRLNIIQCQKGVYSVLKVYELMPLWLSADNSLEVLQQFINTPTQGDKGFLSLPAQRASFLQIIKCYNDSRVEVHIIRLHTGLVSFLVWVLEIDTKNKLHFQEEKVKNNCTKYLITQRTLTLTLTLELQASKP